MSTKLPGIIICLMGLVYCQSTVKASPAGLNYVEEFKNLSVSEMHRTGIPASIKLAQGMFESSFGKSFLAVEGNNHFGVKCRGEEWKGETVAFTDDAPNECFRKYVSSEESYIDHSEFLKSRSWYNPLFTLATTDYQNWAYGLKEAGYATDPRYPEKIIELIEQYDLNNFDALLPPTSPVPVFAEIVAPPQEITVVKLFERMPSEQVVEPEYEPVFVADMQPVPVNDLATINNKLSQVVPEDYVVSRPFLDRDMVFVTKGDQYLAEALRADLPVETQQHIQTPSAYEMDYKPAFTNAEHSDHIGAETRDAIQAPPSASPDVPTVQPSGRVIPEVRTSRTITPATNPAMEYDAAPAISQAPYQSPPEQKTILPEENIQTALKKHNGRYIPYVMNDNNEVVPASEIKTHRGGNNSKIEVDYNEAEHAFNPTRELQTKRTTFVNRTYAVKYPYPVTPEMIAHTYNRPLAQICEYNDLQRGMMFPANTYIFMQPKKERSLTSDREHLVNESETLWQISQQYGIKLASLRDLNKIPAGHEPAFGHSIDLKNPNSIFPKIKAPAKWNIGRKNKVEEITTETVIHLPVETITEDVSPNPNGQFFRTDKDHQRYPSQTNTEVASNRKAAIANGQTQNVAPVKGNNIEITNAAQHPVQAGETLYAISRKYNTTVEALRLTNQLADNTIQIGQTLVIPAH